MKLLAKTRNGKRQRVKYFCDLLVVDPARVDSATIVDLNASIADARLDAPALNRLARLAAFPFRGDNVFDRDLFRIRRDVDRLTAFTGREVQRRFGYRPRNGLVRLWLRSAWVSAGIRDVLNSNFRRGATLAGLALAGFLGWS